MQKIGDKIITSFFVFVFAIPWLCSVHYYVKPRAYHVKIHDVFGKALKQNEIRTVFSTREVAMSYIEEYKKSFPNLKYTIQPDLLEKRRMAIIGKMLNKDHK